MQPHISKRTIIALLMSAVLPGAWAVTKCTDTNGRAVYQDAPCQTTGITVADDIKAKAAKRAAAAAQAAVPKPLTDEDKIEIARSECGGQFPEYPSIGMAESTFKNCTYLGRFYREHTSYNETVTAFGTSRQYIFRPPVGITYLYTRDGIVTAIQR